MVLLTLLLSCNCMVIHAQIAFEKAINGYGQCIIESIDHDILYCGYFYTGSKYETILGKLDWYGNEIWNIIDSVNGLPWGLVQLPDSNIVIAFVKNKNILLKKLTADGDSISAVYFSGDGYNPTVISGRSLAASQTGNLFLSYHEEGTDFWGNPYSGAIYKLLNASFSLLNNGVPTDYTSCGFPADGNPSQVKTGTNGNYFYGSNIFGSCLQSNIGVMNSNGESIWLKKFFGSTVTSLDPLSTNNGCYCYSNHYIDSSYLGKYDEYGNLLWEKSMAQIGTKNILTTPDEGVVIGYNGIMLKRYDSSGNFRWSHLCGTGYDKVELDDLKLASDNTYLGIGTASIWSTGEYFIYIFRTFNDNVLSVDDPHAMEPSFDVFPNPAIETVRLESNGISAGCNLMFTITDLSGKIFKRNSIHNNSAIDIRSLSPGIYLIQLSNNNKPVGSKLLVKVDK